MKTSQLLRYVCGSRRLCVFGIVCCFVWFWGVVWVSEDYDVFDRLDVDADPIYTPRRRKEVSAGVHLANESSVQNFPVIPVFRREKTTTAAPLVENDVIPNGGNFSRRLEKALTSYDRKRPLIVSVVDYGFVDLGLNFLWTSIEPLALRSVFFMVCLDTESVKEFANYGYDCLLLDLADNGTRVATDFGTEQYYRKTNVKTWVLLQFLKLGRTVLLSDVDIVFFRNPFPYFGCSQCDIHVQMDQELHNSGFVYVRPTVGGLALYENAWRFYLQYHTGHDQAYINMAIRVMTGNKSLTVEELPSASFPCGLYYFEHSYRHFYNEPPCHDCVIAHNNYMGTTASKIYRFKENCLWKVDRNGYYSDPAAKYLIYDNPYDFGKMTFDLEAAALLNAFVIAELTNRIVVLPSFRCCNCRTKSCDHPKNRCSLLSVLVLKKFDAVFGSKYREHSFLQNALVPEKVKKDISPTLLLNTTLPDYVDISLYLNDNHQSKTSLQIFDFREKTLDEANLRKIFARFSAYHVLRLHSLYGTFQFEDIVDGNGVKLVEKFRAGIKCGHYEQWEVSLEEKFFGKNS